MPNSYDYFIIGQGLAGSILAYRLIQSGKKVLVIDNQHHGSSSKVAAGIINPITGYRLTTNLLFSEQRNISLKLYKELENLFTQQFITELDQFRLLKSEEQSKFWNERKNQSIYNDYAGKRFSKRDPFIQNEFDIVEIHKTLRINTSELLLAFKQWLLDKKSYLEMKVDYHDIEIQSHKVIMGDLESKNIIFCEGYQAIHNPWWKHLPFKLSKGEILKIKVDKSLDAMLNWQQWLIPDSVDGRKLLLGSTYHWGNFSQETSLHPSQEAKDDLLASLKANTNLKAQVLEQRVGIRPTPTHRFPYIGQHKTESKVYCFNGFGSKGCLTIPYYSTLFAKHLSDNGPLPEDITRWL